ncbi:hypothetical protein [Streptomyces sp. NPDC007083]|uniref:hypothetical protein n=1 Tax=unclassified Streptomyces TaxID=2593676 RepID=UPI0033D53517
MTVGWCARAIRAGVFAALCAAVAALGHVLMSGTDVPAWALTAGTAATGTAGWYLTAEERGLALVVTVAVAAQTVLHSVFSLAQAVAPERAAVAPSGGAFSADAGPAGSMRQGAGFSHPGTAHPGSGHLTPAELMPPQDHMGHMDHSMNGTWSSGMLATHLLAALLCGLWLAYGEKAAFRILRAAVGRLAAPLRLLLTGPPAPQRPRIRAAHAHPEQAPVLLLLVHAITSRGPPATPTVD